MTDPRDAPDGWFRDFGLPLSKAVTATVTKGLLGPRLVLIQAFQNAILTYDAKNPQPWRVERANVGRDEEEAALLGRYRRLPPTQRERLQTIASGAYWLAG
jgi:hypothetical protein